MDQYLAALLQAPQQQPQQVDQNALQQLFGASPLPGMFAEHFERITPRLHSREIDPGATWGGRDRNAIRPDDILRSYFMQPDPENI